MIESVRQLDPAAGHPGMIAPTHLERSIDGKRLPGLGDLALAGEDEPGQHQRLRARAAFGQAAFDEELVDPALRGPGGDGTRSGRGIHVCSGLVTPGDKFHTGAMKANRGLRPLPVLAAAALATLAASCSERIIPPPTPTPTPSPRPAPPPPPAPVQQRPAADWRQAPITPGDWRWSGDGGQSVARFAGGTLVLRCDRRTGGISLQRAGSARDPQPMTITTTSGTRTVTATPLGSQALAVTLGARDPVLDAMAFSRGRFAVEAPGTAPLYVPSWPEISRVIEDCRQGA